MTIKTKLEYGDVVYIKNDPEQKEYTFVGLICRPGSIKYELSYLGDIIELYDFEVDGKRNELKMLGVDKNGEV